MQKDLPMFMPAEAEAFIKHLFEDVFFHGKAECLEDFYLSDAVGHFREEILSLTDIKHRLAAIQKNTKHYRFIVQEVIVINDLIMVTSKQQWLNQNDQSFHEACVFITYRIVNQKIAEWWLMLDNTANSYKKINEHFQQEMKPFENNYKNKQVFFERLREMPPESMSNIAGLPKSHQECLYYYLHGFSAKEMGLILELSPRTVEGYLADIKENFYCHTKHELRKKFFPE